VSGSVVSLWIKQAFGFSLLHGRLAHDGVMSGGAANREVFK